ncbi:hypothetical protein HOI83_01000 [Candidatus Uhrbacteria bacterium]|jgi:hypothetical protein|nr:hypothetical protein [Candidatus Uhrbacteria bacterium]
MADSPVSFLVPRQLALEIGDALYGAAPRVIRRTQELHVSTTMLEREAADEILTRLSGRDQLTLPLD